MSINQVNNFREFNFPTFQKILNSTTGQKIAFIFMSVLTVGILPLAILVYDISNAIISDGQARKELHVVKLEKVKTNNLYNSLCSSFNYKIAFLVSSVCLAVLLREQINLNIVKPLINLSYEKTTSFFKDNKKGFFIGSILSLGVFVGYKQVKQILSEEEDSSTPTGKTEIKRPPAYNPECGIKYPILDPNGLNPRGEGQ